METMKSDVLVVGAGPAGSVVARMLAEKGFGVTVIERRKEIGIPVRCGEGFGELVFKICGVKPHKDWAYKTSHVHIISPSGHVAHYKGVGDGYVVERRMFDKLVALKAVDAGAKLFTNTTAVGYKKGEVKAEHINDPVTFKADLVIAADGVESYLTRMSGLSKALPPYELASCFQYEMQGVELIKPIGIEIYAGSLAPRGYAWIFPKGKDRANVGLGVAGDDPKTAKEYLDAFVNSREDLRNASITQVSAGNISVTKPLKHMVLDNFMVIGTAARQVGPLHGGGIWDAVKGAEMAAEVAIKALKEGNLSKSRLAEYEKNWYSGEGNAQIMAYKLRKVLETFTDGDYDYYIKNFRNEYIRGIDTVEGAAGLLKHFMKRGKFSALIKGLLA